ncbi:MAG: hypothetical protein D3918_08155 [Candidatus Electrothrix sp. AX2]|nr:hypothetical protein [Candidatus Electrothrix gigas]
MKFICHLLRLMIQIYFQSGKRLFVIVRRKYNNYQGEKYTDMSRRCALRQNDWKKQKIRW